MTPDEILNLIEKCKALGVETYEQDGTSFKVKFNNSMPLVNSVPLVEMQSPGTVTFSSRGVILKSAEELAEELPPLTKEMIESLLGQAPPDLAKMSDRALLLYGTGGEEAIQEEELEKQRIEHALHNQSGAI